MKPLTPRFGPRETQPLALQALRARFITVYGGSVADESRAFVDKLLTGSSLLPHVVDADGLTASQTIQKIAHALELDSHLLLCIHGRNAQIDVADGQRTQHYLKLTTSGHAPIPTEALVQEVLSKLKWPAITESATSGSRPFIYLFSCESGALRKQIHPGSALWKSAYLIAFSGSRSTSINSSGNAMRGVVAYVDYCQRSGQSVDPMKLMLFAGLRSGESVTLMGGELAAPLVWHAPKSLRDMSDTASLKRLSGAAQDLAKFEQAVNKLRGTERRLLPAASLMELLCGRIARDDATQVTELLAADPTLVTTVSPSGDRPLCIAAGLQASNCLVQLLKAGADPNIQESDGSTPLMFCVRHLHSRLADIAALLAHGADTNLQDNDGDTALMLATRRNNVAAMQLLLARDARIDLFPVNGVGCLEDAALHNRLDALALLLASGAGPSSGLGRKLIDDTVAAGRLEAARMLQQALDDAAENQEN